MKKAKKKTYVPLEQEIRERLLNFYYDFNNGRPAVERIPETYNEIVRKLLELAGY